MSQLTERLRIGAASALRRPPALRHEILLVVAVAALALLLALNEMAALSARTPTAILNLGTPESSLLVRGFHAPEQDGVRSFRWSAGEGEALLLNTGAIASPLLGLRLGAGPAGHPAPDLTIALDDAYRVTLDIDDQPRHYRLLVPPPGLDGQLTVRLISATTIVPPDTRAIGLRVEELTLHALGESAVWPAPGQLLPPAALLATVAWMLWRLRWRAESIAGGLVVAGGLLLLVQRLTPGAIAPMYVARISGAAVVLAALTALVLPALERRGAAWGAGTVRALWAAALLACAARLFGTLYPPFDAYDLSLNLGRFVRTVGGALVDTNRSFEFRSGVTVYPAGPYLALMPGVLLGLTPKLAVQGGIALVDGLGALATGWLALRLGLGSRTAIFGAVLYAGLPVMLTSLWFGHTAQVFGQALMVPLALALLAALERDQAGAWLAAAALLSMALLSHIGVTVLAVAWLGMAWLAVGRGLPQRTWWRFFLILAAACTVGLALVYGPAAQLKVAELTKVGERVTDGGGPAYNLIWRAFQISFYELGWPLALVGLALVRQGGLPRGGAALIGAWLAACALFWAVEMVTALQVRYLVMLAPLACLLIGTALARFWGWGAAGRGAALAMTVLLLATGLATWYIGIYQNVQMSMVPLLR